VLSAGDLGQEPLYSRPHQRSRDVIGGRHSNWHLPDDEPMDDKIRGAQRQQQLQTHAKYAVWLIDGNTFANMFYSHITRL